MKQNKTEARLVYSSDGSHLRLCKQCGSDPCECITSKANYKEIIPEKITIKMRLEKNQRGGKLVTVLIDLPFNPPYFEDLAKKLKNHCGSGGTFKNEGLQKLQIEIQGDQRNKIETYLLKLKFKILRAGG